MISLLFIGIFSFVSSFTVSHITTREILRYKYEQEIYQEFMAPKKDSLVKFNTTIRVRTIPSTKDLSSNTLSSLWYDSKDYYKFKLDYSLTAKYNSI
jgi:hypothetical protein